MKTICNLRVVGWPIVCVLAIGLATSAQAGSIDIVPIPPSPLLPNTTTHDILLDSDPGEFIGASEIYLQLVTGSVLYAVGGAIPLAPTAADIIISPPREYLTFLACGSSISPPACSVVGASQNLGSPNTGGPAVFAPATLDAIWGPALGQDTSGVVDWLTARITMTDNAAGFVRYRTNFFGNGPQTLDLPIYRGIIGIPEPANACLCAVAILGVTVAMRRRSR